jgi:site-specific DNA-adenine methylase
MMWQPSMPTFLHQSSVVHDLKHQGSLTLRVSTNQHFNRISHFRLGDFGNVIDEFDSPTTYFYVDPPYWKTENYYSNHDFDVDDHKRLADKLTSISGKFSLSYYDFDLLSLWYPKETYTWEMKEFAKAASATKGKTQNMGQELLIMNY